MVSSFLIAAAISLGVCVACAVIPGILLLTLIQNQITASKILIIRKLAPLAFLVSIICALIALILFLVA